MENNVTHINDKYCIKRTGANIVLVEKQMIATGENKGSINYINKGYYSTFEGLLFGLTKQRDKEIQEYVESVLKKQHEYNDLQLVYECTPSVIIYDVNSFRNFCDMVYEFHEIQNVLSLKKVD